MKKKIAAVFAVIFVLATVLSLTASAQRVGYKEPIYRPTYVEHYFERQWTSCPHCDFGCFTNYNEDRYFINGELDHIDPWGGVPFWCPVCGHGGW